MAEKDTADMVKLTIFQWVQKHPKQTIKQLCKVIYTMMLTLLKESSEFCL